MSNVKHPQCKLRTVAKSAKARLSKCAYDKDELSAPRFATPQQRDIYSKLVKLNRSGEIVSNPIAQFGDQDKLLSLAHEERQRYVLTLCADYIAMKNFIEQSGKNTG